MVENNFAKSLEEMAGGIAIGMGFAKGMKAKKTKLKAQKIARDAMTPQDKQDKKMKVMYNKIEKAQHTADAAQRKADKLQKEVERLEAELATAVF